MISLACCGTRPGFIRLGGRAGSTTPKPPTPPASERRGSPLLAAATGPHGRLIRRAAPGRRGSPGPATPSRTTPSPHRTPVPTPAHSSPRAIRVHRSPR
ncbi:hypothetical protein GCM10010206_09400 [Streptomyces cinerochromogenes]|nr:hypothetical protein GCM10010206_09400 [Streptomyces cinerochromogenes]